MRLALTVLARAPEPGRVKTRLAATVGADTACEVHVALALDTLDSLGPAAFPLPGAGHVLAVAGDAAAAEILAAPARSAGWRVEDQAPGDLGARIACAVSRRLAEGFDAALVAGSDAPLVGPDLALEAAALLVDGDAVLAPALDGGFVLMGARRDVAAALAFVPWGTPDALQRTMSGLAAAGLRGAKCRGDEDVDDLASLLRLGARLPEGTERAPRTAGWIRALRGLHGTDAGPPRPGALPLL